MTWVSLALALVKLANLIFGYVQAQAAEQVGEDRERLRVFETMAAVSAATKAVDEKYAKMTDAEIKSDIEANKDFRD